MYSPRQSAKDSSHFIEGKGKTSNEILFLAFQSFSDLNPEVGGCRGSKVLIKFPLSYKNSIWTCSAQESQSSSFSTYTTRMT